MVTVHTGVHGVPHITSWFYWWREIVHTDLDILVCPPQHLHWQLPAKMVPQPWQTPHDLPRKHMHWQFPLKCFHFQFCMHHFRILVLSYHDIVSWHQLMKKESVSMWTIH